MFCQKNYMDLKFRLEAVLGRPVDLVIANTLKPRLKPIIEQEVVYAWRCPFPYGRHPGGNRPTQ